MAIELAGVKLEKVHKINTLEKADFVYQNVVGMNGNLIQNLGRGAVFLSIEGICYGREAKGDLEKIRTFYLKGEPLDFLADIAGKAYVSKVMADSFFVKQSADEPDQFSYKLVITEYVKSAQQSAMANEKARAKMNNNIKTTAKMRLEMAKLPDALAFGSLPELTNPFEPLDGAMTPVKDAGAGLTDAVSGLKKLLG